MRLSHLFGAPLPHERAKFLEEFEGMLERDFSAVESHLASQSTLLDTRSSLLLAAAGILVAVSLVLYGMPSFNDAGLVFAGAIRFHITASLVAVVLLTLNLRANLAPRSDPGDTLAFNNRLRSMLRVLLIRSFRYALAWWVFLAGLLSGVGAILSWVWGQ